MKNAALVAFSFALALVLGELAVRAFMPARELGTTLTRYDPVYGKRMKPSFESVTVTPEFTMRLKTNSLGYRGPEMQPGAGRAVIFLGDSMTFGYGVSEGEDFPALVRAALARKAGAPVPVFNAGVPRNGTGHWLKFLAREAPAYSPRLVVLQSHLNDEVDELRERLYEIGSAGELKELPIPPQDWRMRLRAAVDMIPGVASSHLVGLVRQIVWERSVNELRTQESSFAASATDVGERLSLRLTEEVISICRRNKWPVLYMSMDIEGDRLSRMQAMLARMDVPAILLPTRTGRPELRFPLDGHLNAEGHKVVAQLVLDHMARCCPD